MSKRYLLFIAFTLALGIALGVTATGLVYASSETQDNAVVSRNNHMGSMSMIDHHNSAVSLEDCEQDFETHHGYGEDDFDHSAHHSNMH